MNYQGTVRGPLHLLLLFQEGGSQPRILQYVDVIAELDSSCADAYDGTGAAYDSSTMFCASNPVRTMDILTLPF